MSWLILRKTIKAGPFSVTLSKRGLTGSVGNKVGRVSASTDGRSTRTLRIPGKGIQWRRTKR